MDDMNAFERQVAGEFVRRAGPVRPVNAAAIFTAITATQSPKLRFQSMFSATKFLVAGAILALFGGFLLSEVLTHQPSDEPLPPAAASASATAQAEPTDAATTEPEPTGEVEADGTTTLPDLLPGVDLVTEEFAPGVYRVLSDGVRGAPFDGSVAAASIDGSVWLRNHKEVAVRLGDEGRYVGISAVGPDGTPYGKTPEPGLSDFTPNEGSAFFGPDGTVWVTGTNGKEGSDRRPRIARLDADGWARIAPPDTLKGNPRREINVVGGTPDGTVYATVGGPGRKGWMYRFRDDGWEALPTPPDGVGDIRVGHDGAVWGFGDRRLARLEDGRWMSHDLDDLLPALRIPEVRFDAVVAADGALWFFVETADGCTGPYRFDGSTITLLMEDYCGPVPVAAPSGNVWVTAIPYERVGAPDYSTADLGLYVITPEAVAD